MPIRTQLRLPQISGSLKSNVGVGSSGIQFHADNSAGTRKDYLQFDTTNNAEMVKIADVDLMLGTGTIRDNSGDIRFKAIDAGALELGRADGTVALSVQTDSDVHLARHLQVGGDIEGDADEAKSIFAQTTTPANGITLGGGGDVIMGGDIKLSATGRIEDSNGDARFVAINGGDTLIARDDGTTAITITAATGDVTIAGDLTVEGTQTAVESTITLQRDKDLVLAVPQAGGRDMVIELAGGVSAANPAVITSNGHGFNDDEFVYLFGHSGTTIPDGVYQVKSKTVNTFQIREIGAGANLSTAAESGVTDLSHASGKVVDGAATNRGAGLIVPHQSGLATIGFHETHGFQVSQDLDLADGKAYGINAKAMLKQGASDEIVLDLDGAGGEDLTFPLNNGANGEILQVNGSGVLSFIAASSLIPVVLPNKTSFAMDDALAANSPLSGDGNYAALNVSSRVLADADLPHQIDVFVNGQLLASGSGPFSTDVSAGGFTSGDYLGNMTRTALDFKLSFDLEKGDIVQIIERTEGR